MMPVFPAVFVNGERQPDDGLHVSGRDRGLTLADGLFETMRAHAGAVFRLGQHLERLRHGLRALDIAAPAALQDWITAGVAHANGGDAALRLTVTRGVGAAGLAPPADATATVLLAVTPFPAFPAAIYKSGLSARVASGRRNEHAMTAGLKTLSYTDSVAALIEARRAGDEEAIFLDTAGHCSEATASNLFVLARGALLTPPVSCAALPGVTRATVIEIASRTEIPAREEPFDLDVLMAADEVFLTSSLRGIAPVVRIDGQPIGAAAPGPFTRRISALYAALVAQECRS